MITRLSVAVAAACLLVGCGLLPDLAGPEINVTNINDNDAQTGGAEPPCSTCGSTVTDLGFACAAAPDDSSIRCTWQDGQSYTACATHPDVGRVCESGASPLEWDPEEAATEERTWSVTLEAGGAVLAGPVSVTTET